MDWPTVEPLSLICGCWKVESACIELPPESVMDAVGDDNDEILIDFAA